MIAVVILFTNPLSGQRKKFNPETSRETLADFLETDPALETLVNDAFGYAVFPKVGKGGIGIGGAHGKGVVFEQDEPIGGVTVVQVNIGFQLGGQSYAELILFENEDVFTDFIENGFTLSAQASAVALQSGASANAKYKDGVLVITKAHGGLMYEASIGGQKFTFKPFRD